jgi:co-chaperonin GroES (HSP10)
MSFDLARTVNPSAALPQPETGANLVSQTQRTIRPLGEQIIIRVIPPESVGSIIIPDSAKRSSYGGSAKATPSDELQYVNRGLYEEVAQAVRMLADEIAPTREDLEYLKDLSKRAQKTILPKSAKGIPQSSGEVINFVEAEVIAVGPGKRGNGDPTLIDELAWKVDQLAMHDHGAVEGTQALIDRAQNRNAPIPLQVKPGDRILYHPAVQSFDRKIPAELLGLPATEECYICNEMTSVLAVLERD